jgi:hypothetical protein
MAVRGRIPEKEKKSRVDRFSAMDGSDWQWTEVTWCHRNRKEEECSKIST